MDHEDRAEQPQGESTAAGEGAAAPSEAGAPTADSVASGRLGEVGSRLDALAAELEAGPEPERADQLVREASELAAEAGREVEAALRDSAAPDGP